MLEKLKTEVCKANLDLVAQGLVLQTWGNVSGIDRERGLMVIKPSGLPYAGMKPRHMVVVALADGNVVEGNLKPSSDTPTHRVLYQAFPSIGGVVHTHSLYATAWAQACKSLPCFGTTQADYWYGDVPCTRKMKPVEVKGEYELNTGKVIIETFKKMKCDPEQHPSVLVASHGPFSWGHNPHNAVHNAAVLEFIARLASETLRINPDTPPIETVLIDKHFSRKHGLWAYYGQK
jgi:L-ribulose-5-phosphate 4-epimerase